MNNFFSLKGDILTRLNAKWFNEVNGEGNGVEVENDVKVSKRLCFDFGVRTVHYFIVC